MVLNKIMYYLNFHIMKRGFTAKLLLPATFIVLTLISLTGNAQT